jgi:hypothetical protein
MAARPRLLHVALAVLKASFAPGAGKVSSFVGLLSPVEGARKDSEHQGWTLWAFRGHISFTVVMHGLAHAGRQGI